MKRTKTNKTKPAPTTVKSPPKQLPLADDTAAQGNVLKASLFAHHVFQAVVRTMNDEHVNPTRRKHAREIFNLAEASFAHAEFMSRMKSIM